MQSDARDDLDADDEPAVEPQRVRTVRSREQRDEVADKQQPEQGEDEPNRPPDVAATPQQSIPGGDEHH